MTAPVAHTGAGNVTTNSATTGTTLALSKPSNTVSGDLLVAVMYARNAAGTWTAPTNWVQLNSVNTAGPLYAFAKYIGTGGAETATSYTFTAPSGGRSVGTIFRVTGAHPTAYAEPPGSATNTGSSTIVAPATTAVSSTALLVACFCDALGSATVPTITAPSGMTQVTNVSVVSGASSSDLEVDTLALSAAGSTGTKTATVSPSATAVSAFMFTIAPGSPPPAAPAAQTGAGNVTTATVTASPVLRCAKPSNTADGDVLVAWLYTHNSGSLPGTTPPGWTQVGATVLTAGTLAAYWKRIPVAANEYATNYTWRSVNGAVRGGVIIFRVTGAGSTPIDVTGAMSVLTGSSAISDPAVTTTCPVPLLLACHMSNASSTSAAVVSAPTSMSEVGNLTITDGSADSYLEIAAQTLSSAGTSGTMSAAISPSATNSAGMLLTLAPAGYGTATTPVLLASLAGGVTSTAAVVSAVTKFVKTGVRIALSTSASMTSPTYSPGTATAPNVDGILQASFSGLTANTTYYYAVELDGTLDVVDIGTFTTLPADGVAANFSFAAASCAQTDSNATTFDTIRTWTGPTGKTAQFFVHLGDLHYQDIGVNDQAWALGAALNAVTASKQQALYRSTALAYTWSDHDSGGPNDDDSEVALPASAAAYRELFPSFPIVPTDGQGIYQTWRIGRVRFVMTDGRSYSSPIANTDNSSKTKLGVTQKAWWKTTVNQGDPLVIWLHEDAWNGGSTYVGDDTWTAYSTERAELATFIQSNNVPLYYIHGDYHCLGADDGQNAVVGGFPIACASPMDQTPFNGNGVFDQGFYPNPATGGSAINQFGWFDVLDNGSQIVIRYYGIASGVQQLYMEASFGAKRHIGWGAPM